MTAAAHAAPVHLPRFYPILDRDLLQQHDLDAAEAAAQLRDAGCTLIQYRNKSEPAGVVLAEALRLREQLPPTTVRLLLNDRVDLARLSGADGIHVGQTDLAPADARHVLAPGQVLGLSTHSLAQFRAALEELVDYLAIGPIFSTSTKFDADPVVGLDLLRQARSLTQKPIVAIGGITLANAARVIEAGADSVAVISALFASSGTFAANARSFLHALK